MKYLSWDIGIKNLSFCFMDENKEIIAWEIIDISGENKEEYKCDGLLKNKNICGKKAGFYNLENSNFYCNRHSKEYNNLIDVNKVKCSHILNNGESCGKKIGYNTDEKFKGYCKTHGKIYIKNNIILKEIEKKDAKGTLDDITMNLLNELDTRTYLLDADVITIENQPAFKNPKMKSIQMIIYTYFNIRGRIDVNKIDSSLNYIGSSLNYIGSSLNYIARILFLSASNKLKIKFDGKEELEGTIETKNKYKKNKELAKLFCLEFLEEDKWKIFFKDHKKRDDLADTYLMNIYQIQIDKK